MPVQYGVANQYRGHSGPRGTTSGDGMSLPIGREHLGEVVNRTTDFQAYLFHGSEHLIAAPLGKAPVIVVLFDSSHANRAVAAAAASKEPASRDMALTAVESRLRRSHNVPVGFSLMVHRPGPGHVHVVHVLAVLAGLKHEDFQIRTLGQTASDDGPARPTACNDVVKCVSHG